MIKLNIKTRIILAISAVLLAVACSHDDDNFHGTNYSTRQTTDTDSVTTDSLVNDSVATDTVKQTEILPPDEMGANPYIKFYSLEEEDTVRMTAGESQTAQAPLIFELIGNVGNPDGYHYICEWRIWSVKDNGSEDNPLVTRFEQNTSYTLTKSGGYGIKLYVTFSLDGDTIEYESEPINIVISESKLVCPDGFSPNNDSINDTYRITAQSIVKLDAKFFNRWGEKIHTATLETAKHVEGEPNKLVLWDGKHNGKVVSDGVYILNLYGLGSDGLEYKIRKSISIMTKFHEGTETNSSGGGS
ncbi:MAG: gliding motility-associated C-terminal domain-containing protein [Bacteroidaceae bacterium]|nr:gliding motility-associated C-terminal domain-containing protein [Bacteroidaceae bacterium]